MTAVEVEVEVNGAQGLHARPAAAFADVAARFASDITVVRGDLAADGKSMLLLLTLDVRPGDRILLRADGPDAGPAVDALAALVGAP